MASPTVCRDQLWMIVLYFIIFKEMYLISRSVPVKSQCSSAARLLRFLSALGSSCATQVR